MQGHSLVTAVFCLADHLEKAVVVLASFRRVDSFLRWPEGRLASTRFAE
jgi:hypothetical protein